MFLKKLFLWVLLALTVLSLSGLVFSAGSAASLSLLATTPTAAPAQNNGAYGPDSFPEGVNPLTGLQVKDPTLLKLRPAMISISNFPASARPQAGLSSAAYVFELYIGEGMTRFLGLFYGDYPEARTSEGTAGSNQNAGIGPIRSGRLPYESLRKLFNGFLVMSGASPEVKAQLNGAMTIFGSDNSDINSALIDVTKLKKIAEANGKTSPAFNLTGNLFKQTAPTGGKEARKAWIFYNFYNQIEWIYDPASGAYLRYQDQGDGTSKFQPATDRLNGEQLAFENVVVLFAEHTKKSATVFDVHLMYRKIPALLFRDGQVYRIFASTENGAYEKSTNRLRPMRYIDDQGNPFPMKPGQTWVEIVTQATTALETSPGNWKIRFYAP